MEEKNGYFDIKYKYWNGIEWSFYNPISIHKSNNDVIFDQYSLIVSNNSPCITFSTKNGNNTSTINLAIYSNKWNFIQKDTDYLIKWLGMLSQNTNGIDSSSSISQPFDKNIVTSDGYNICVYSTENNTINLLSSLRQQIINISSFRISSLFGIITMAYIDDNAVRCNFYNTITNTWAFSYFIPLINSLNSETIIDLDISCHDNYGNCEMFLSWISSSDIIRVRHSFIKFDASERISGSTSIIKEEDNDLIVTGVYYNGGYKNISVGTENNNETIICSGSKKSLFKNLYGNWNEYQLNIDLIDCGRIIQKYDSFLKLIINSNNGVYYYENTTHDIGTTSSSSSYLDIHIPQMILMTEEKLVTTTWNNGYLTVSNIGGSNWDCKIGTLLSDPIRMTGIFVTEEDPIYNTSSSSSTNSSSTSSSRSSLKYSSSTSSSSTSSSSTKAKTSSSSSKSSNSSSSKSSNSSSSKSSNSSSHSSSSTSSQSMSESSSNSSSDSSFNNLLFWVGVSASPLYYRYLATWDYDCCLREGYAYGIYLPELGYTADGRVVYQIVDNGGTPTQAIVVACNGNTCDDYGIGTLRSLATLNNDFYNSGIVETDSIKYGYIVYAPCCNGNGRKIKISLHNTIPGDVMPGIY
jgi:hypothetical protein